MGFDDVVAAAAVPVPTVLWPDVADAAVVEADDVGGKEIAAHNPFDPDTVVAIEPVTMAVTVSFMQVDTAAGVTLTGVLEMAVELAGGVVVVVPGAAGTA